MKKIGSIIIVLLALLLFNSVQTFTYYLTRIGGDIDFYDVQAHFSAYINAIGSLLCTLMAWKWLSKFKIKKFKFLYAFLVTIPLFAIYVSVFHILIRAYYGGTTTIEMLGLNFVFMLSFSHFYVSGFTIAYLFFDETNTLKEELIEKKYEIEKMQLQMLKKNIEPHFLFNNLSVLSSLARKDSGQIDEFIEELAAVYRYFLQHNATDSVKLKEELNFLEKYCALTTRRFDGAYSICSTIDNEEGYIIPFALQICLENAIKHNEGSETNPLKIEITREKDIIRITNPLRLVENTSNTGLGLSNITKRYQLLFNKELFFGTVNDTFVVEIPIIAIK